jgi:2,4-dienoyl-CoA reductase (NADPH2)
MASNRISDPRLAEKILQDRSADMINLARVLMADPDWPVKALEERPQEIRPCIACLQGCMDELFNLRPAICSVNPRTGFEGQRQIRVSPLPRRVMVIGGGPAGMESAFRAAQAGHQVELYEKGEKIGGQLWLAGTPPHKQEFWELIHYYEEVLASSGVKVFLNREADLDLIIKRNPDYIIAAEGAESSFPAIDGLDSSQVFSAWEVLSARRMWAKELPLSAVSDRA